MILLIHILIALLSLIFTGLAFISPSKLKLNTSYALAFATLFSGTYLVLTQPVNLARACVSGITYLAVIFVGIYFARKKFLKSFSAIV